MPRALPLGSSGANAMQYRAQPRHPLPPQPERGRECRTAGWHGQAARYETDPVALYDLPPLGPQEAGRPPKLGEIMSKFSVEEVPDMGLQKQKGREEGAEGEKGIAVDLSDLGHIAK